MDLTRRRALGIAGTGMAGLAGCARDRKSGSPGTDTERVDTPPQAINEPSCDPPADGRDPLWLCENVAAEPSLQFEQAAGRGSVLADGGLQRGTGEADTQVYATLLTAEADRERIDRGRESPRTALVEEAEFDTEAVLVAQTGWGSGSITPHLERIERTEDGVHAVGCYRRPCVWTDDVTSREVVARFERPAAVDSAVVSLTVDAGTRVNFAASEGVVTLE